MRNLSWVALVIILLSACQAQTADRGFLYGTPCPAPCWYGITPGVTDKETAIGMVQDLGIVEQDTIRQAPAQIGFRRTDGHGTSIRFKDDVVTTIAIGPAGDLTLAETVAAFGPPSLVLVSDISAEKNCYKVELFYPMRGIEVNTYACQDLDANYELTEFGARIAPEMQTTLVTYWQPADTLEEMLLQGGFHPDSAAAYARGARPWTGFGYYLIARGV